VVLAPQEARRASNRRWYQTATTDSTGRFNVPSAAPGEYKLFAWPASEDILLGAYMDTEFRRPVEEKGQALTLREGESRTVALKILPLPE